MQQLVNKVIAMQIKAHSVTCTYAGNLNLLHYITIKS